MGVENQPGGDIFLAELALVKACADNGGKALPRCPCFAKVLYDKRAKFRQQMAKRGQDKLVFTAKIMMSKAGGDTGTASDITDPDINAPFILDGMKGC